MKPMDRLGKFVVVAAALALSASSAVAMTIGTAEPGACFKAVCVSGLVAVLALVGVIP